MYGFTNRISTLTLVFDDPRIRPLVCLEIVRKFIASQLGVYYIDFDLQFSSLLQNLDREEFDLIHDTGRLVVLQPSYDVFEFMEAIAGWRMQIGGILILDSLNSLQSILTDDTSNKGSKIANQKTLLLITILQEISRFYSKSLIIINVTKSRPSKVNEKDSTFWEKTLVGGRMIKFKSDAILSVKQVAKNLPLIEISVQQSRDSTCPDPAGDRRYQFRV